MLVNTEPKVYEDFLVYEGKGKVLAKHQDAQSHLWHATVITTLLQEVLK
jgi:hypothetical protein